MDAKLTQKQVAAELRSIGMTFKKVEGEYQVNYRGFSDATTYYTTDLVDALGTGRAMRQAERNARKVTSTGFQLEWNSLQAEIAKQRLVTLPA